MSEAPDLVRLSTVKAYVRHTKGGKAVEVREHTDSRVKKLAEAVEGGARPTAMAGHFTGAGVRPKHFGQHAIEQAGAPGATLREAKSAFEKKPTKTPLTPEEYAAHTKHIETQLLAHKHLATDKVHGLGKTPEEREANAAQGLYNPKRAKAHAEIANRLYEAQAKTAKSEGRAVIMGGLGGAGKSTILRKGGVKGVDPKHFITANPDDVKEEMAKLGMVPKVPGLSPMESAGLIHEESGHIANMVAARALAEKKNLMYDITMSSKGSVSKRVEKLRNAGYKDVKGVFVDIPVEKSVSRALSRHRKGMELHRNGEGAGGRYVSPTVIRANKSASHSSANREVFEHLKPTFDTWERHDASGDGDPVKVESSDDKVKD